MQNENKVYDFDVEVLTEPTTSLVHPISRFWLISNGGGTLAPSNRPYHLKPGTVVSMLPWQISDIVEVAASIQFFIMTYYFDNINETIETFYNPSSDPLPIMQSFSRQPVLYLEGGALEPMWKLFLQIRKEIGMKSTMGPGRDSHVSSSRDLNNLCIADKLIEIIIYFLWAKGETGAPASPRIIESSGMFQYLYNHLNEETTLIMLSKIFYMSGSSISAYVTKTTGLSFFDLLGEMRIGRAISYLLYADFTLEGPPEIPGSMDNAHIGRILSVRVGMKANDFHSTYQNIGGICRIKGRKGSYSVTSYIYRHYSEDLHPKTVAEQFNISPRGLSHVLPYQMEMNSTDYLNFIRVNGVPELLFETTKDILEIALETGYSSEKTPNRNPLKFCPTTPSWSRQTIGSQEN